MKKATTAGAWPLHRLLNKEVIAAFACILTGLLQIIAAQHAWMLWITLFVLSGVGFWSLFRLLFTPDFVTAWSVYATSITLSYGFGTLNTMLSSYADGASSMLLLTYATQNSLGLAAGATGLIAGSLLLVGNLDPHKIIPRQPMDEASRFVAFTVVFCVTVGMIFAMATGALGFQATQFVEEGSLRVSPFASLISASATPALGLAALAYARQPSSPLRWLILSMCFVLVATQISSGRRVFMFNMLAAIIMTLAALDVRKVFTPRIVILLLTTAVVLSGASRYFMAMREAGYTIPESAPLSERMEAGWDLLKNANSELDAKIEENQRTRTFIIGYFGELLDAYQKHGRTAGGDLLLLNIAYSAPTAIWPGKWAIINRLGSDEVACHRVMGLPAWDAANSVPTEGLCDFGWPGLLLYPLLLACLLTIVNWALRRGPVEVRAMVASSTIASLLHTEGNFFSYMTNMRNVLILVIFTWTLTLLVRKLFNSPSIGLILRQSER